MDEGRRRAGCAQLVIPLRLAMRTGTPLDSGILYSLKAQEADIVADQVLEEVRDLLKAIRDLLVPVHDAYIDRYQEREAEREADRRAAVKATLSTEKRRKAWILADGTRTQRQIAQQAAMDEGGASRFFKTLRDLRAISDDPNPKRAFEVE
jgi:hypothetical protein